MTQKINRVRKPKVWRGEVKDCPPSANVFERLHWAERSRLIKAWNLHVYTAFFHDTPTQAVGRRKVRVVVTSPRERDHANLWLGVDKLVHDNLTKMGFIVDDSQKFLTPIVEGQVGTPHTLIEIWGEGL